MNHNTLSPKHYSPFNDYIYERTSTKGNHTSFREFTTPKIIPCFSNLNNLFNLQSCQNMDLIGNKQQINIISNNFNFYDNNCNNYDNNSDESNSKFFFSKSMKKNYKNIGTIPFNNLNNSAQFENDFNKVFYQQDEQYQINQGGQNSPLSKEQYFYQNNNNLINNNPINSNKKNFPLPANGKSSLFTDKKEIKKKIIRNNNKININIASNNINNNSININNNLKIKLDKTKIFDNNVNNNKEEINKTIIPKKKPPKKKKTNAHNKEKEIRNYYRTERSSKYKILDEETKENLLKDAMKMKTRDVSKKYGISTRNINRWKKIGILRKKGSGRKFKDPKLEEKIITWFFNQRENTITSKQFKRKALELSENKTFKASTGWMTNLKKKYHLIFKKFENE